MAKVLIVNPIIRAEDDPRHVPYGLALLAGITELPALVTEAVLGPQDIQLRGDGMFDVGHILGLARPPLVADFHTAAAISSRVRERRYGVLIDLVVKPLLIGV